MKISSYIPFLFFVTSCLLNPEWSFISDEPKNDWERDHLFNRVKQLEQSISYFTDSKKLIREIPVKEFRKKYTDFGYILFSEYFDGFGKIKYYKRNEYNARNQKVSAFSENYILLEKFTESYAYNEMGYLIASKENINDSIDFTSKFEFDSLDNIVMQLNTQGLDTTSTIYSYKYDEHGRISVKVAKEIHLADTNEFTSRYRYDRTGLLIGSVTISRLTGEQKWVYEYYKNKQINKKGEYESGQLIEETLFDLRGNPVNSRYFENSELTKELTFQYKFDQFGNWIEKKAEENENPKDQNSNIPIYIQTREIEYYK